MAPRGGTALRVARVLAALLGLGASALALSAVFAAPPFRAAADLAIERTELPAVLRRADGRLRAVEELPGNLWKGLHAPFASGDEGGSTPEPPVEPSERESAGPLESAVAGGAMRLVELGLRVVALAAALSVLAFALALWVVTGAAGRVAALGRRARQLEARVAVLEAAGSPPPPGR